MCATINPVASLTDPLTAEQVALLKIIWSPITRASTWGTSGDWPLWDFVARQLHRELPRISDAEDILMSLPAVTAGAFRDRAYGLVWRSPPTSIAPSPDERIGLTIAGLAALAKHQGVSQQVPDQLAAIVGNLASRDSRLEPKPYEVIKGEVPLATFTAWFAKPISERTYVLPNRTIANIFHNEYAPVVLFPFDAEEHHQVQLGRASLRRYLNVASAADYLERIDDQVSAHEIITYSSPLSLVQTFDYLAYVLAADSAWTGKRLTAAPDLQSAAAVSAAVSTRHEFETALSGLCTVIDQLAVPEIPRNVLDEKYNGKPQPSINRLDDWLGRRLDGVEGANRVVKAIAIIRAVRDIRVEAQHSSASTRERAIRARQRLGLPQVISDWGAAWHVIQDLLAGALDVIRQEVQAVPPPT